MLAFYLSLIDNENDKIRFEEVYYTYKKQMAYLANSILHNHHDAEDVVHDVFCSVASSHIEVISKTSNENDVRTYLLRSVRNASISVLRKKKVRIDYENAKRREMAIIKNDDFIDQVCAKTEYEKIVELIDTLESKYRDVLYYHLVLDLSVKETAEILGRETNTVRQQLLRGKNMVVAMLSEKGEN